MAIHIEAGRSWDQRVRPNGSIDLRSQEGVYISLTEAEGELVMGMGSIPYGVNIRHLLSIGSRGAMYSCMRDEELPQRNLKFDLGSTDSIQFFIDRPADKVTIRNIQEN